MYDVLRSPGQPLDADTRAFMEPRFGHDFSNVRVHIGASATESARAVNALAYTVGQDIVFETERFQPRLDGGRQLLAHELAHTIQQRKTSDTIPATFGISEPGDASEREAHVIATAAMRGRPSMSISGYSSRLARQTPGETTKAPLSPAAPQEHEIGAAPEVKVVPDKSNGKLYVFVDDLLVYYVQLPNAQGGVKALSLWKPGTKEFELKLAATPGAKIVEAADGVKELGRRFPKVLLQATEISLPRGLPILVQEGGRSDPDLKYGVTLEPARESESSVRHPTSTKAKPSSANPANAESGGFWESVGEWVHGGLDVVGVVPGLGEIADGINAVIYLAEGRHAEAAISVAAMIPIVGDLGKIGKWTVKGAKELAEVGVERSVKELAESAAAKTGQEVVESGAEKGGKELAETEAERAGKGKTKTDTKRPAKDEPEASGKKQEKDGKLAQMRLQVQWGTGKGGPTFGLAALAPWNIGVTAAEAVAVLTAVMALVQPKKARLAAEPAYGLQVKWIWRRPPAGLAPGVARNKREYFQYKNYTDARVEVENLRGHNLKR